MNFSLLKILMFYTYETVAKAHQLTLYSSGRSLEKIVSEVDIVSSKGSIAFNQR